MCVEAGREVTLTQSDPQAGWNQQLLGKHPNLGSDKQSSSYEDSLEGQLEMPMTALDLAVGLLLHPKSVLGAQQKQKQMPQTSGGWKARYMGKRKVARGLNRRP